MPSDTPTTLTNIIGNEINISAPKDITFIAQRNGDNIEILYKHDFSGPLTFATSTVYWTSMVPPAPSPSPLA